MPQAAAIAGAIQTAGAHRWSIFLAGQDVAKEPGGQGAGVDPATVEVVEAMPGRVSTMTFTADDPRRTIEVAELAELLMIDNSAAPESGRLFLGYASEVTERPAFGGQGRTLTVRALGAEVWLDWLRWYDSTGLSLTWNIGGSDPPADLITSKFQGLPSPLKIRQQAGALGSGGLSNGIAARLTSAGLGASTMTPGQMVAGMTWRDALQVIQDSSTEAFPDTTPIEVLVTVDFYLGLRAWRGSIPPGTILKQPDDYNTLTVTEAAVPQAGSLAVRVDWGELMHRVYVAAANLGASGVFDDGSGATNGPVGSISRPDATTQALAAQQARAFLANREAVSGGSFELLDVEPDPTVHAGGLVTITDTATGTSGTWRITEIRKTFLNSSRQNWEVTFGAPPRRAIQRVADLIRRKGGTT